MNIYLIGPMGAGKSTIGRILAQELELTFYDIDRVVQDRTGADIPWIFDVEGEDGFRDREQSVLAELSLNNHQVIATGGGVVIREQNRTCLRSSGYVIFLQVSVEQQLERTEKDKNRPLLQTENPRRVLEELNKAREPLYMQSADLKIKTDKRHPRNVAAEIVRKLADIGIIKH